MIEAAEARGPAAAGGTIVEPTSGNTGVGLAMVAARRRYRCVFTMPDKIAEREGPAPAGLRRRGDRLPDGGGARAPRLLLLGGQPVTWPRHPGAFQPDQYHNPRQPGGARGVDRTRDLAADRRAHHPLRGRHRHRRHHLGGRALPEEPEPGDPDHRRRPGGLGLLGRQRAALPGRGDRRGLLAEHLRPVGRRPGRHGLRPRLVPHRPAGHPGGGHPGRRVLRHRRVGGPGGRRGSSAPTT